MKETYSGMCVGGPCDGRLYQCRHNSFRVGITKSPIVSAYQPPADDQVKYSDYEYCHQKIGASGIWCGEEFSSPNEALDHVFGVYAATKRRS